ncbi:hypothetical protein C9374_007901 [Naegleria lovaniensis]|uniref:Thioredoxin-like fold domain-containing protein n=1 Tax=Naegleria lovaniensis TaxID=51637 RepID=A0AA88GHN7_NAELO|nr:uncharacterized protein C9374_007901 [Naegleria lovaniensis]KAG2378753.1 hypothetical protein C9374_007901 [Naegleria lovaniensis]
MFSNSMNHHSFLVLSTLSLCWILFFIFQSSSSSSFSYAKTTPLSPPFSSRNDILRLTPPAFKQQQPILIEFDLYVDLLCSDSAAWWTSVFSQLDSFYFSNSTSSTPIRMNLYLLPLPYHTASYLGSMTYVGVNRYTNYDQNVLKRMVNSFFTNQAPLYNNIVNDMTQSQIMNLIYSNNIKSLNVITQQAYMKLVNDPSIDMRTRTLFKLSTATGVFATPSFYVNKVPVENGEDFTAQDWIAYFNQILSNSF